ncbi:MAG: outer membrane protein transport protein [Acidobacteriota bacterium]
MPIARALIVVLVLITTTAPAFASGFYRFQHGGRATAQVGAMTARADDPSAVFYNPAGITQLDGFQLLGGLDFNNATDDYSSATSGIQSADHVINFPPAIYATWTDRSRFANLSFGLGIDTAYWYRVDWDPVFFEPRFRNRLTELRLWEVHPVVAWKVNEAFSVGGGIRYQFGSFDQGANTRIVFGDDEEPGTLDPAEITADAEASVDGLGFDLAAHWTSNLWGWGAVYRSAIELEGDDRVSRAVRDQPFSPDAQALLAILLDDFGGESFRQTLDLPAELRGGVWFAPYPELKVEINASYQAWSDFEQRFDAELTPVLPAFFGDRAGWDDTVSIRLGAEGRLTDALTLTGGLAYEPSPVPEDEVDPGFPRGDAMVYALGLSYEFPKVIFDLGYSIHDHDSVTANGQEPRFPDTRGTYSADDQVWSASARWKF